VVLMTELEADDETLLEVLEVTCAVPLGVV